MSSKQILDLLRGSSPGAQAGALLFLEQRVTKGGTPAQRRLLAELRAAAPRRDGAEPVARPWRGDVRPGAARAGLGVRPSGPLSPSAIAWLQRLPADPAQMSERDVTELAALVRSVPSRSSDATFVLSVWRPVEAHWDKLVASSELEVRGGPLPAPPASAVEALADALLAEGVDERAVATVASEQLTGAVAARDAAHERAFAGQRAVLAES